MSTHESISAGTVRESESTVRVYWSTQRPRTFDHELMWGVLGTLGLIVAGLVPAEWLGLAPVCPFKEMTGHPCMTCGTTRAVWAFAHGHVTDAFIMNPLAGLGLVLMFPYLIYAWTTVLFRTRRLRISLRPPWSNVLRVVILLALVCNWIYLIWVGR